jgi:hypothetical protein
MYTFYIDIVKNINHNLLQNDLVYILKHFMINMTFLFNNKTVLRCTINNKFHYKVNI